MSKYFDYDEIENEDGSIIIDVCDGVERLEKFSLDPLTCKLMGLCLYAPGLKAAYIPINHRDPETKIRLGVQLTEEDVSRELQKVLEAGIKIIMHNGKFDYEVLKCTCDICVEPHWDTMVATRLLNENERYGLKEQYISKIDKTQEKYNIEKLFKDVQYADVQPEIFALYSAMDSFMTYKLYEYQLPLMDSEKNICKLFMDIEMPLVVIVAEMELCGALADLNYCQKLKDKYESKLASIDTLLNDEILKLESIISSWKVSESGLERERVFPPESVVARTDQEVLEKRYPLLDPTSGLRYRHGKTYASQLKDPINLSSPKQLAILLYKVLGANVVNRRKPNGTGKHEIEAIKYEAELTLKLLEAQSKTSEAKGDDVNKLKGIASICELLSKRRQVEKIITTYLNPVPALANHWSDGKIRFHLNQLGARTGRFTSGGVWKFYDDETPVTIQGMNAQNLPAENHEIRLMFKAEPGRIFVGGDISQQEPKITAHISLDENMLQVYEEGKDKVVKIGIRLSNEFCNKKKAERKTLLEQYGFHLEHDVTKPMQSPTKATPQRLVAALRNWKNTSVTSLLKIIMQSLASAAACVVPMNGKLLLMVFNTEPI